MLYTAQPVIAMAVFDQDVSAEFSSRYPPLYKPGMRDMFFNRLKFATSAWQGLWTSFVLVGITLGISQNHPTTSPSLVLVSFVFIMADYLFALRYTP